MTTSPVPGYSAVRRDHSTIARRRTRLIVGALFLAAITGPCSLLLGAAGSSGAQAPTPPRYAGFAQGVAEDYLAGRQTAMPTRPEVSSALGRVAPSGPDASGAPRSSRPLALAYDYLIWDSATRTALGPQPVEIHRFLVGANRQIFVLFVSVAVTSTGPVVHSLPSLAPAPLADTRFLSPVPYEKIYPQAVLSVGAKDQIQSWAKAFAAGDERALYVLSGDAGPRRYRGLNGYEVVGTPAVVDPYGVQAGVIAQVKVQMRLAANPSFVLGTSYDLLLTNLERALPTIAAWGPSGSGPTLVPFSNADRVDVRVGNTIPPTLAPAATLAPSEPSTTTSTSPASSTTTTARAVVR